MVLGRYLIFRYLELLGETANIRAAEMRTRRLLVDSVKPSGRLQVQ